MKKLYIITLLLFSNELFAKNCIAHRGDNENFLENSKESIIGAMNLKAHGIEFDLQHTKDGIALVFHDKKLERTAMNRPGFNCPLKKKIKKITFNKIRQNCILKNGEDIPSLDEILELTNHYDGHLFIEFKDMPSFETLDLIARTRSGREDKTRFISFKRRYLKRAYKLRDKYPLYAEIKMLNINVFSPFAGRGLGLDVSYLGKHFLFWAKWWKKEVGIWTVDKLSVMKKLFKKKVPFITTNRVTACMELSTNYDQ